MNRLATLDWLRGLLAVSIMVYHLCCWELGQPDASTLLGRLGIYGVSMFFVLSGLSMAAGYSGYIVGAKSAARFMVRRIFRIWPLLWVAVAVVVLGERVMNGRPIDWPLLVLNVTTLFGFFSPGSYVNTGAWSIGNEMVYYCLTPFVLSLCDKHIAGGNVLVWALMGMSLGCGYWLLDPRETLAGQWLHYVYPWTNLYLYLAGIALYYNTRKLAVSMYAGVALMILAVAVFAWAPGSGDLISVVTGPARLVFSSAAIALVFSFYKTPLVLPNWASQPLAVLGVATYGVYLLHPIVYQSVKLTIRYSGINVGPLGAMTATIIATIGSSIVIFHVFESRFIELGKRLTRPVASPVG